MFKKIAQLFTGDPHKRKIEQMVKVVDQVNALESQFEQLSDAQLSSKTDEFRSRLAKNESLDDLLPEAFAVVREASKRVLGQRHYDTQIICGINLHQGSISELRTGEGKTLSATMPLYLNALSGKGAHLVTVNDYLARWQGRWMGQLFRMLGMSVGILQMAESSSEGERAYIYDPNVHNIREDLDQLRPVHRAKRIKQILPTEPTASLALITCAITSLCAGKTVPKGRTILPLSMKWIAFSSMKHVRL